MTFNSALKNTMLGATMKKDGNISFVSVNYRTGQVHEKLSVAPSHRGD